MKKIKKIIAVLISKLPSILYGVLLVFLVLVAVFTTISAINTPLNLKLFTVKSGSMWPKIPAGSLTFVLPSNSYKVGDVITFKSEADLNNLNPKNTTTHRIYAEREIKGEIGFETKGDYNDAPDFNIVSPELILGKVVFSVPLLGYPVSFAKTKEGLIILVVIPATLIIYTELINIKNEAKRLIVERRKRKLSKREVLEEKIGEEIMQTEKGIRRFFRR